MNPDSLTRSRCRPIRVALRNAIYCFVYDVDEFARPCTDRVHTENLGVRILYARTGGGANPVVLSDDNWEIGDRVAVWRAAKVFRHTGGLVIRSDLIAIEKVDDVGIECRPFPTRAKRHGVNCRVRRSITHFERVGMELQPIAVPVGPGKLDGSRVRVPGPENTGIY